MRPAPARNALTIAALLFATGPTPAASLAPAGKWIVDYAPARCVAVRDFGSGEEKITLSFKPSPFSDLTEMAWVRDGKKSAAEQRPFFLQVDQDAADKGTAVVHGAKSGTTEFVIARANLSSQIFSRIRQAHSLRFQSDALDVTVALDQLPKVAATLAKCIADLQEYWNMGPVHGSRLKKPPRPVKPLASLFSSEDYPAVAFDRGKGGATTFMLLIDEKGMLADCSTIATTGTASLDTQPCAIIGQRGKFAPAIDVNGRPAKGTLTQTVRWVP